jgi:hypothetical protein
MLRQYDEKAKRNTRNRIARQLHIPLPIDAALLGRHDSGQLLEKLTTNCNLSTMTSFAVVRNPYNHAVSHFNFLKTLPRHRYGNRVRGLTFCQYLALRVKPAGQVTEVMRKDYWFLRLPDQTSFVCDGDGHVNIKHVIRLEKLAVQWPQFCESLGLPETPLQHRNKGGNRDEKPYSDYYDQSTKALVEEIYHRDFQNFGYSHETLGE